MEKVYCPSCHAEMVLKDSKYGQFYSCINYPKCRETHGAHPDGRPMGKPATSEVRKLRIVVHSKLNEIWNYKDRKQRKEMYKWLEKNTMSGHVSMMDREEIGELFIKLERYAKEKENEPVDGRLV